MDEVGNLITRNCSIENLRVAEPVPMGLRPAKADENGVAHNVATPFVKMHAPIRGYAPTGAYMAAKDAGTYDAPPL